MNEIFSLLIRDWFQLILPPSNSLFSNLSPRPNHARNRDVCRFYRQTCSGIPLAVRFVGRDRLLWNSMVQGTQRFRQVRAASCVIPYVLCGGLYCLRCWCLLRGSCPPLYILTSTQQTFSNTCMCHCRQRKVLPSQTVTQLICVPNFSVTVVWFIVA